LTPAPAPIVGPIGIVTTPVPHQSSGSLFGGS
jgi:hypothetical protein